MTSYQDTKLLLNLTSFLDPRFKATCPTQGPRENVHENESDRDHLSGMNGVKNRVCEEYKSLVDVEGKASVRAVETSDSTEDTDSRKAELPSQRKRKP